jgi:hypothetical protein
MCGELRAFAEQEVGQRSSPSERLREVEFEARKHRRDPKFTMARDECVARSTKVAANTFATPNLSSFSPPPRPLSNDRTGFFFMAVELVAVAAAAATSGGGYARASESEAIREHSSKMRAVEPASIAQTAV